MRPLNAYAKLNLSLNVLDRLADGYHEVDTLLIRLRLHDRLLFAPSSRLEVRYANIARPENDIVSRAIEGYAMRAGGNLRARVEVEKRIPMEAGLGGGSADAGAVLLAMQEEYRALDARALTELALGLGVDVPYCMRPHPCRGRGKGERLTKLNVPPVPLWFLLVKPEGGISTRALFSSLDIEALAHPDTEAALSAWMRGDIDALCRCLGNSLEAPAISLMPEIGGLLETMRAEGPLACRMTGSGSTVFGLFSSQLRARDAARRFADCAFCAVTRSL